MNAQELQTLQAPLKVRYKERPQAALMTLRAQGLLGEGITCRVETGDALTQQTLGTEGHKSSLGLLLVTHLQRGLQGL